MKITILVDNINSWALPYAKILANELKVKHSVNLVHSQDKIKTGDIAVFLSCEKLVKDDVLKRNKHNLVAHASALPKGKGWSPLTWQILENKNVIPITLFEAANKVDAGVVYERTNIKFNGNELLGEMHDAMGIKINKMIINFVKNYSHVKGIKQVGKESFYKRRHPEDSELDPKKAIAKQFNLLRIVDNDKYPAFFNYRGKKYILKIFKHE